MKPQLVNYDEFFKKKAPLKEFKVIHPPIEQLSNTRIFFNILCFLTLVIGIIYLSVKRNDKDKNQKLYNQKVINFFHKVNSE